MQHSFNPEQLLMIDFKLIKEEIYTPQTFFAKSITSYNIENTLALSFNLTEKLIKADFNIRITTQSENPTQAFAVFHFSYIFKVENLEHLHSVENETITLQKDLANALSSVSYSTSRGILLVKLQSSNAFQDFILPIVNAQKLVSKY